MLRVGTVWLGLAWVAATGTLAPVPAAEFKAPSNPVRKPYGLEQRVPFTTSRVIGSPDPLPPYRTEIAFAQARFSEPLELVLVPGSNRLAVAQRRGKLFTFDNQPQAAPQLLIDLGRTVYGLAFHPQFGKNGQFFVTSVLDDTKTEPRGSRLSRFTLSGRDPLAADVASEEVLLEWPSGGHNGGCIRFGPDGYLYLVTGDGSGIADQLETGQDVSDLLASMLRIDVDQQQAGLKYRIPDDNPFVGQANARPEIWAYGLRQAWKFSFAPEGRLWAGEVGQDLWEMIYLIQKGGNYGWSVQEGKHPFRPQRPKGPTPIRAPIVEHPHSDFRSITGGYVYGSPRLPELRGAYIYGDYDTGKVWLLRWDEGQVREHRELADTQLRIVAFGHDSAGEVLLLDFIGGAIHRLVPAPPPTAPLAPFPRKLSETGLFASTTDHQVAPGLIPYSVNAQLWSDGAIKERFLAVPGQGQIEFESVTYPQPAPGALPGWRFPDGTVVVKTFYLDLVAGDPRSRRRLETRILHYEHIPGTEEVGSDIWRGYTYIWNDEQTDATLAEAGGQDRVFTIKDALAPGGERQQTWHFPSRTECNMCHTTPAKYVLGLNTQQLNKDHDYDGVVANQLRTLEHLGLFTKPLPQPPEEMVRLVDYTDAQQSLDLRARSYLHANCSHCHRKWGGGNAEFQLLANLPLTETGIVDVRPAHGQFELTDPRLLVPGRPERSVLAHRMTRLGLGRMPHIASSLVDRQAVELIDAWIRGLPEKP